MSGSVTVRRSSLTSPASDSGRGGRPLTCVTSTPELVEEPRRLLAVVLGRGHRRHHQALPRAGAGDVEQAPLLEQQLTRA